MERYTIDVSDEVSKNIVEYASRQQVSLEQAIENLIELGSFVFTNLSEGRKFIIQDGARLRIVDWDIPEILPPPVIEAGE